MHSIFVLWFRLFSTVFLFFCVSIFAHFCVYASSQIGAGVFFSFGCCCYCSLACSFGIPIVHLLIFWRSTNNRKKFGVRFTHKNHFHFSRQKKKTFTVAYNCDEYQVQAINLLLFNIRLLWCVFFMTTFYSLYNVCITVLFDLIWKKYYICFWIFSATLLSVSAWKTDNFWKISVSEKYRQTLIDDSFCETTGIELFFQELGF